MQAAGARRIDVIIEPERYGEFSPYDLLQASSRGLVGFDHRLLHAILDRPEEAIPGLVHFAAEYDGSGPINLEPELIALFQHFGTPEAMPFYIKVLRGHPEAPPEDLTLALIEQGQHAVEPLLDLYREIQEHPGEV